MLLGTGASEMFSESPQPSPQVGEKIQEGEEEELQSVIEESAEDDETVGEQEPDEVEVEIDGKVYKVAKDLEGHLLRQEDYTKKTQALRAAEENYAKEMLSIQERAKLQDEYIQDITTLRGLDQELHRFSQVDWDRWAAQQPAEANRAFMRFQQLKDQRQSVAYDLQAKVEDYGRKQQSAEVELVQKTVDSLRAPDPEMGWPGYTPQHMKKLTEAARTFGITDEEMQRVKSPVAIRILNLATIGMEALKASRKSPTAASANAQPARRVKGGNSRASSTLPSDSDDMDTWVRKERQRMAKLGSPR